MELSGLIPKKMGDRMLLITVQALLVCAVTTHLYKSSQSEAGLESNLFSHTFYLLTWKKVTLFLSFLPFLQ